MHLFHLSSVHCPGIGFVRRVDSTITNAWEVGFEPQTLNDASIVTIYKKGDRTDHRSYRGIALLSIADKNLARILLYQVMDALTMKYTLVWPMLVHLSTDYTRDSGTTTMCACGVYLAYNPHGHMVVVPESLV